VSGSEDDTASGPVPEPELPSDTGSGPAPDRPTGEPPDREGESVTIGVYRDENGPLLPIPDLDPAVVERLARRVLAAEAVTAAEIDIVFCGDERITALNREWLDSDRVTDVIAFGLTGTEPGRQLEGEIYIDLEQAVRQAPEFGVTAEEEIVRLIVHGLLHLAGYTDTGSPSEVEAMMNRQEELVKDWDEPIRGGQN